MNKQNFFCPKKNNWDIGWPCSPRLSSLLILGMVVVVLLFTLISCDSRVTISQSEYNRLKGINIQTKRTITFPEGTAANFDDWEIIQASDGHDYLENNGGSGYVLMHYIECNKCKNK
jgi:hypothetical protein